MEQWQCVQTDVATPVTTLYLPSTRPFGWFRGFRQVLTYSTLECTRSLVRDDSRGRG